MVTSALTREQLVILQLKTKLASGELKLSEVMTQLIEARGLNVAEVHEASAKNLTLISTSPAQVLWQVRRIISTASFRSTRVSTSCSSP